MKIVYITIVVLVAAGAAYGIYYIMKTPTVTKKLSPAANVPKYGQTTKSVNNTSSTIKLA